LVAHHPVDLDGHALRALVDGDENASKGGYGEQRREKRSYEPNQDQHGHDRYRPRNATDTPMVPGK
jgi:hypothetical protein